MGQNPERAGQNPELPPNEPRTSRGSRVGALWDSILAKPLARPRQESPPRPIEVGTIGFSLPLSFGLLRPYSPGRASTTSPNLGQLQAADNTALFVSLYFELIRESYVDTKLDSIFPRAPAGNIFNCGRGYLQLRPGISSNRTGELRQTRQIAKSAWRPRPRAQRAR